MDGRIIKHISILFFLISLASFFNVSVAAESKNAQQNFSPKGNPYSPKAFLIRYWNHHISKELPKSSFLLSKASPLTASQHAHFTKLANQNNLSSHYASFCHLANLFCLPDPSTQTFPQGVKEKNGSVQWQKDSDLQFANYNMSFSSYIINNNNTGSSFRNYSDETNFGFSAFKDYSKEGESGAVTFINYTQPSSFTQYTNSSPSSFAQYNNSSPSSFAQYRNSSEEDPGEPDSLGKIVKIWVELGKFFREFQLKEGNVTPMPDIRDKMPRRSFLPKSIVSKLPFSSSRIKELKEIFHAADNSTMQWMIKNALVECERNPSPGETKKCVGSIEDMVDFATSVLGHNVVVRTTKNVNGSSKNVMIGSVKAVNGGKLTKAVSCHQSLYPYMLYYCHSVPKVRVYEAEILDVNSKKKMNHGVAICHLDTSTWSPRHAAFVALGYGPGKIEVCHWIFENDMTWTWDS